MNDALLRDWTDFCEGRKWFDKSHFYTLFMEETDPKFFEKVFQYSANSDALLERMGLVVGFGKPEKLKPKIQSSRDALKFASFDLHERVKIADKYGEPKLIEALSKLKPRFCEDIEEIHHARQSDLQAWQLETVGGWFVDNLENQNDLTFALLEANYGLTTSLELNWFLGVPLLGEELNLDNYAELWKVGADYAVDNGELLVGSKKPLVDIH